MPKQMTAEQILTACPPRVAVGAKTVIIKDAKPSVTKDKRQRIVCKIISTNTLDGNRKPPPPVKTHTSTVEALVPDKYIRDRDVPVRVSCTCDDFWATWEVALFKRGAAKIQFSNGELPVEKNPRMIPGCCKHLYKMLQQIRGRRI